MSNGAVIALRYSFFIDSRFAHHPTVPSPFKERVRVRSWNADKTDTHR